jgi:plasmid stability protein
MKSITIHGVNEEMDKKIRERAKSEGRSVNKVVKELLGKALGLEKKPVDKSDEYRDLCGIWMKEDLEEFESAIKDLEKIAPSDWK